MHSTFKRTHVQSRGCFAPKKSLEHLFQQGHVKMAERGYIQGGLTQEFAMVGKEYTSSGLSARFNS